MNIQETQHIIDLFSVLIEETQMMQDEIISYYNKVHDIQSELDNAIEELTGSEIEELTYEKLLDRCYNITKQMKEVQNHLIESQLQKQESKQPSAEELYELACEYEGEPVQSMQAALDKYGSVKQETKAIE